jgi:hypothetical protein
VQVPCHMELGQSLEAQLLSKAETGRESCRMTLCGQPPACGQNDLLIEMIRTLIALEGYLYSRNYGALIFRVYDYDWSPWMPPDSFSPRRKCRHSYDHEEYSKETGHCDPLSATSSVTQ